MIKSRANYSLCIIVLMIASMICITLQAKEEELVEKRASLQYEKGPFHRKYLGDNYRDVWSALIETRVFDLSTEKGGLKVVKKGGGQQTLSLRLEAKDGKQYTLRSLEKYTSRSIPSILRKMFVAKLIQDQMSMTCPYAALAVPALAEAAGVYHTNPEIVYVPDDPAFGEYRELVAEGLFLFEERPAGNWKDADYFANSKEIIGTPDLLKLLRKDPEVFVDQKQLVLSRLFDMWINDRDRHDDQWRWARVKKDGKKLYKPIPRDRDWAFFLNEGKGMKLASKRWISTNGMMWSLQGLDDKFTDIVGLNFIHRHFDRTFLTEMSEEDWIEAAEILQKSMTDDVIENAFKAWPKSVYDLIAEETITKLKSRRSSLKEAARTYYQSLADIVDIPGTDEEDEFEIIRVDDEQTKVTVYCLSGKTMKRKFIQYQRVFKTEETSEIRLYGRDDNDIFNVSGNVNKGINIRIVGGEDADIIMDESNVRGLKKHTYIYDDSREANEIHLGVEGSDRTVDNPAVHEYNRSEFKYNTMMPVPFFGYNKDDGYFAGGGMAITKHGFRRDPYAVKQIVKMRYAAKTSAFTFGYKYKKNGEFNDWGMGGALQVYGPSYVTNYFGLGNKTTLDLFDMDDNEEYNYVRMSKLFVNLTSRYNLRHGELEMGLFYQTYDIENSKGRYISDFENNGLSSGVFQLKSHAGINFIIDVNKKDNPVLPNTGMQFSMKGLGFWGLNDYSGDFSRFQSHLKLYYHPFYQAGLTAILDFGGTMNWGDYDFIEMGSLGSDTYLRGYRRDRFRGDAVFYQNTELRMKLFHLNTYWMHGSLGLSAFHDIGRVWLNGEDSDDWHQSVGGGIWFAPFDMFTISMYYAASPEDKMITFRFNAGIQ